MGRPEFETVVASAPKESLKNIDLTGSISVAAGAMNVTQFFAPSGYVGEILGIYTSVQGVPASTTGTHAISFGYPQFKVSRGTSNYNGAITWNNSYWSVVTTPEPPTGQTQVNVLKGIKFDDTVPFECIYTNNTDKPYSASRSLIITYMLKQVAK